MVICRAQVSPVFSVAKHWQIFQRVYWKRSRWRHIWESLLIFEEAASLLSWSNVEHKCPVFNVVKHLRIFQRVYWKRSRLRHIWESLLIFKETATCCRGTKTILSWITDRLVNIPHLSKYWYRESNQPKPYHNWIIFSDICLVKTYLISIADH